MTTFIIASTVVFGILTIIWKSDTWVNQSMKFGFLGMLVWGIVWIVRIFGVG